MLEHAKRWARAIKRDVAALYIAGRDRRTPWYAKAIAVAVAAYALSPIDLIPDFIPVLGYLDDLVIVPIGILIAVRLMPGELMAEFRDTAARRGYLPSNWLAAGFRGCLGDRIGSRSVVGPPSVLIVEYHVDRDRARSFAPGQRLRSVVAPALRAIVAPLRAIAPIIS